ncbi:MAG TPA: NB-ARC domain-containing protein [Ktedonobacteraceae bacterium]|nr:NB-ARC domain-containing protein [Ktedonobacteraceae bacterium]
MGNGPDHPWGPYFRAKLCELFGKSAQEPGLRTDTSTADEQQTPASSLHDAPKTPSTPGDQFPPLWSVPYPRNPHFTGRDEIFEQLDQHLLPESQHEQAATRRAALAQPQAIKGLGGIGKTQITLEYAYRAREQGHYTHVFWINAASEEAIITGFVALADLLPDFSAKNETDQRKVVTEVKRWLEQCQQSWLLIFDNVEELSLVQEYLPVTRNGSILLTTRASAVGSLAISIEVEQMGLIEGTQFLLHRAQRLHATDEDGMRRPTW